MKNLLLSGIFLATGASALSAYSVFDGPNFSTN
jgi:hypothetical protein